MVNVEWPSWYLHQSCSVVYPPKKYIKLMIINIVYIFFAVEYKYFICSTSFPCLATTIRRDGSLAITHQNLYGDVNTPASSAVDFDGHRFTPQTKSYPPKKAFCATWWLASTTLELAFCYRRLIVENMPSSTCSHMNFSMYFNMLKC